MHNAAYPSVPGSSARTKSAGRPLGPATLVAAALSLTAAAGFITRRGTLVGVDYHAPGSLPGMALLAVLVFGYLALCPPRLADTLAAGIARAPHPVLRALAWPAALWVGALTYAAWVHVPVAPRALAYGVYVGLPVLVLGRVTGAARRQAQRPVGRAIAVGIVIVALLVPAALRWLPPLPVPESGGADVIKYLAYAVAAWCFLVVAPVPDVGYEPRLTTHGLRVAGAGFLAFVAVAVPFGLATGFISWHPRLDAERLLLLPVLLTLTTALPEELVFRGIVQRLVEGSGPRKRRGIALAVASVLFGLTHLPDPRYVFLAAIAGVVYGLVYQRTGMLLASVATHVLVDWSWAVFFRA